MATANLSIDNLPGEQWKPIPEWEGLYSISSHGRVKSHARTIDRGDRPMKIQTRILKPGVERHGYHFANMNRGGVATRIRIHRSVVENFIGGIPPGMDVCHNDGNPGNNHVDNLRIDTRSNNMLDTTKHGTNKSRLRTHCPRGHILDYPNLAPWHAKRDRRVCLSCSRTHGYTQGNEDRKLKFKEISDSYYESIMGMALTTGQR